MPGLVLVDTHFTQFLLSLLLAWLLAPSSLLYSTTLPWCLFPHTHHPPQISEICNDFSPSLHFSRSLTLVLAPTVQPAIHVVGLLRDLLIKPPPSIPALASTTISPFSSTLRFFPRRCQPTTLRYGRERSVRTPSSSSSTPFVVLKTLFVFQHFLLLRHSVITTNPLPARLPPTNSITSSEIPTSEETFRKRQQSGHCDCGTPF
ncbi:hypothetical protein BDD12DRAFT_519651 [Trichophaea hybrida]|nr:hypothetical protein BDD12DRAFT_519651 [Trichophaea hybrida]